MILSGREAILTVDDVTEKLREAVCSSKELQNVAVRGELLGFKRHTSGHSYFTILGRETRVACVLFRSNASSIVMWPKDGDEVLVRGRLDIYGARGSYQIYATTLLPLGEGAKARAKELLMNQLTAEGLFDIRHKRPLPPFPSKVAVITSPTGAALQDVVKISSTRYPAASIVVVPSLMQGLGAPAEIASAFSRCARLRDVSLVMLVRGGGNRDDLDTFDNEQVVRAVRSCPVPVITGLGHQIDKTMADMAADATAPTPSGAAERVFPDSRELTSYLNGSARSMSSHIDKILNNTFYNLDNNERRLIFNITKGVYQPASDFIENTYAAMAGTMNYRINEAEARLASTAAALQSASPLTVLSRGYAICRNEAGEMLKDAASVKERDIIAVQLRDGLIDAAVRKVVVK